MPLVQEWPNIIAITVEGKWRAEAIFLDLFSNYLEFCRLAAETETGWWASVFG
ncbi:hypothetical protein [Mycobacterium gordonae]|jgi:hypothetical protein|uniref:hypothetical protein n=1 Tax=Mycobacterium gordonae TaxID=1778 RepID=UPI000A6224C4|nr:hypothetical protein [Mycobacterium gordonae]MBI2701980.1 hypothetical protein [Mycobacterium sp.]MCV7007321.1 hypothetical protein [Mycobacterium gordonae]